MEYTSTMTVVNCIYKLLKVFSCFIFFEPTSTSLTSTKQQKLTHFLLQMERMKIAVKRLKKEHLTILSNSSPPVTNSKTIYIFDLLAMTYVIEVWIIHQVNSAIILRNLLQLFLSNNRPKRLAISKRKIQEIAIPPFFSSSSFCLFIFFCLGRGAEGSRRKKKLEIKS